MNDKLKRKMEKIAAVVVTYNRLPYLKELIVALREQSRKPDEIIVVDNGSDDGTGDWLKAQEDLSVVTQENLGSSGGQYTGFETAFNRGFDWIWTMDDDVAPAKNCLERLLENIEEKRVHAPLRYDTDGEPFLNDVKRFNLTFPFKSIWRGVFTAEDIKKEYIAAEGITFEGPLFHRSLIEKIGLPEKDFFIHADDSDYFIRAKKAGYKIFVVRDALLRKKLPYKDPDKAFTWKHYYIIRNVAALDVLHGNLFVRVLRPFAYLIKWILAARNYNNLKTVLRAFRDAYFYKSSAKKI